ncbi:MAG: hypothetical protein J7605_03835 [Variovorax sp.]|nr:hypothetical protein [Variovorax sp.]
MERIIDFTQYSVNAAGVIRYITQSNNARSRETRRTIQPSPSGGRAMPDENAKFDKGALSLIESLKGRRKPAKRAPRKDAAAQGEKPPAKAAVQRRATGRF